MSRPNKSGKVYKPSKGNKIYSPRVEKAIALICLDCPLPVKACKPHRCKRYKDEKKKIIEQEKAKK